MEKCLNSNQFVRMQETREIRICLRTNPPHTRYINTFGWGISAFVIKSKKSPILYGVILDHPLSGKSRYLNSLSFDFHWGAPTFILSILYPDSDPLVFG